MKRFILPLLTLISLVSQRSLAWAQTDLLDFSILSVRGRVINTESLVGNKAFILFFWTSPKQDWFLQRVDKRLPKDVEFIAISGESVTGALLNQLGMISFIEKDSYLFKDLEIDERALPYAIFINRSGKIVFEGDSIETIAKAIDHRLWRKISVEEFGCIIAEFSGIPTIDYFGQKGFSGVLYEDIQRSLKSELQVVHSTDIIETHEEAADQAQRLNCNYVVWGNIRGKKHPKATFRFTSAEELPLLPQRLGIVNVDIEEDYEKSVQVTEELIMATQEIFSLGTSAYIYKDSLFTKYPRLSELLTKKRLFGWKLEREGRSTPWIWTAAGAAVLASTSVLLVSGGKNAPPLTEESKTINPMNLKTGSASSWLVTPLGFAAVFLPYTVAGKNSDWWRNTRKNFGIGLGYRKQAFNVPTVIQDSGIFRSTFGDSVFFDYNLNLQEEGSWLSENIHFRFTINRLIFGLSVQRVKRDFQGTTTFLLNGQQRVEKSEVSIRLVPITNTISYRFANIFKRLDLLVGVGVDYVFASVKGAKALEVIYRKDTVGQVSSEQRIVSKDALSLTIAPVFHVGTEFNISNRFSIAADMMFRKTQVSNSENNFEIDLNDLTVGIGLFLNFGRKHE